jgi:hypothetical protein
LDLFDLIVIIWVVFYSLLEFSGGSSGHITPRLVCCSLSWFDKYPSPFYLATLLHFIQFLCNKLGRGRKGEERRSKEKVEWDLSPTGKGEQEERVRVRKRGNA